MCPKSVEPLYIISCEKGLGLLARPFSQLRMRNSSGYNYILYRISDQQRIPCINWHLLCLDTCVPTCTLPDTPYPLPPLIHTWFPLRSRYNQWQSLSVTSSGCNHSQTHPDRAWWRIPSSTRSARGHLYSTPSIGSLQGCYFSAAPQQTRNVRPMLV